MKTYTAERREDLVFTKGVHRFFRNVAQSMTGVSATTAFSSVVIGAMGVVIITIGGHAIADGTMTLGDLIQYIFFTGLMAAPIVQIASIGTQITEAFAGLDRIRELLASSDDEDATHKAVYWPLGGVTRPEFDEQLELRAGVTIPTLFGRDGEAAFRTLESEVLADDTSRRVKAALSGDLTLLYPALAS